MKSTPTKPITPLPHHPQHHHPSYESLIREVLLRQHRNAPPLHLASIRAYFRKNFANQYLLSPNWTRILYRRLREMEAADLLVSSGHAQMRFRLTERLTPPPPSRIERPKSTKGKRTAIQKRIRKPAHPSLPTNAPLTPPPSSSSLAMHTDGIYSPPPSERADPDRLALVRDQLLIQIEQIERQLQEKTMGSLFEKDSADHDLDLDDANFEYESPKIEVLEAPITSDAAVETVDSHLHQQDESLNESKRQLLDLRNAEMEQLEISHAALTSRLREIHLELEATKEALNESDAASRAELERLHHSLQAAQRESTEKESRLSQMQSEWTVVCENLEGALEEAKDKAARMEQLEADAKTLSSQLANVMEEASRTAKERDEAAQQLELLRSLNQDLTTEIERLRSVQREIANLICNITC